MLKEMCSNEKVMRVPVNITDMRLNRSVHIMYSHQQGLEM